MILKLESSQPEKVCDVSKPDKSETDYYDSSKAALEQEQYKAACSIIPGRTPREMKRDFTQGHGGIGQEGMASS